MTKSQVKQLSLNEQLSVRDTILAQSVAIEGKDYRIWNEGWDFERALKSVTDRFATDAPARNVAKALGINVRGHVEGAMPVGTTERIASLEASMAALETIVGKLANRVFEGRTAMMVSPPLQAGTPLSNPGANVTAWSGAQEGPQTNAD